MKRSVAIGFGLMVCGSSVIAEEVIVPTHAHSAASMKTMPQRLTVAGEATLRSPTSNMSAQYSFENSSGFSIHTPA